MAMAVAAVLVEPPQVLPVVAAEPVWPVPAEMVLDWLLELREQTAVSQANCRRPLLVALVV